MMTNASMTEDCLLSHMEEAMDTAVSRPALPAQPAQVIRQDVYAHPDAVRTELAPVLSVQPAWSSAPVDNRVSQHAASASRLADVIKSTEQRFERDRDTNTLVFKQIDPKSGEVIMQLPTQSLLDLRVYLKQQQGTAQAGVKKTA